MGWLQLQRFFYFGTEKKEKRGGKEGNTVTPHTRSSPLRGSQISLREIWWSVERGLGVGKPRSGGDFLLWDGKKGEKWRKRGKKGEKGKKGEIHHSCSCGYSC